MAEVPDAHVRILIVEDDPGSLALVSQRLAAADFACECAETGADGLQHVANSRFQLVLLDLRLPDMDGSQVLAGIRQLYPEMPVIIMTAHGSPELAERLLALGATAYMLKPVSRKDLIAAVQGALTRTAS